MTKNETSAICTPMSKVPSSLVLIDRASSTSLAVSGSMLKIRSPRKSFRVSSSRSGILRHGLVDEDENGLKITYVHGMGGRHLSTFSVKSSVGKLQSFRRALVSTSMSPIGPSSSTKVPNGCKELMGFNDVNTFSRSSE